MTHALVTMLIAAFTAFVYTTLWLNVGEPYFNKLRHQYQHRNDWQFKPEQDQIKALHDWISFESYMQHDTKLDVLIPIALRMQERRLL